MDKKTIIQHVEKHGGRNTPLREMLVTLFVNAKKPLSVPEILSMLSQLGSEVNKTSVYRQIQAFVELSIIKELQLEKDKIHYELANMDHHHHLICNNCQKIEHVEVPHIEKHITRMQDETIDEKGFTIMSHTLEFYGLCKKCIKHSI